MDIIRKNPIRLASLDINKDHGIVLVKDAEIGCHLFVSEEEEEEEEEERGNDGDESEDPDESDEQEGARQQRNLQRRSERGSSLLRTRETRGLRQPGRRRDGCFRSDGPYYVGLPLAR